MHTEMFWHKINSKVVCSCIVYSVENTGCGLHLKCDGTHAETRFCLSAKWTSPFKSKGASVQSTTGSRGMRISGSNAEYTMFRGSVKGTATHCIHQFPLHFPSLASPCAITFQLECITHVSHETFAKVDVTGKCYINMAFNFKHNAVTSCSSRAPQLLLTTPSGSGLECNIYIYIYIYIYIHTHTHTHTHTPLGR